MKTISLELAKQLKEAGYPQVTAFYWVITLTQDYHLSWYDGELPQVLKERNDCYSSPSAEEILDQLPEDIKHRGILIIMKSEINKTWKVSYQDVASEEEDIIGFAENFLADAAAKMWLHLKKERKKA
ncbi:MAG: hypothetical protein ACXWOL_16300 [Ktedonobacteraceae bacterium]